ncbi:bifunctional 2-keto-4-hydroxyglutarate aldolase/2-keto-3-deoxy-6-phosphogluconate aldolase [Faecalicatena sp. AGMB00832]|uniref:Bifunctional 2-keto-4-hydroxyglutarate aldolase/2-keto-3-deoxy-6-phosphogluconate aldolase n=1 Tax=Faecalicatena faecalis TaxID=2726362 RepID=A0ABS6D054_9FIRM|nr:MULTISPECIES: bifunctional 2-keto-4-hydroxyglutarate aldolase/2-keto-3-deoxy-6-phosphogluconate aldolase [Faecalicatena]MBU3874791.1 bifunctional 2-keto-4-hydroxyglutarate aldolase/2-keto-3-deoxy-6-phosphogluconate aldolase [Faecalicatena faecalis]MCI6465840.1 bifunctional 2-keto-4-hydroxyglutarate aldolase/2-keto-3-deoxy-6-phosphogluconate aldolase [Faecalicatena sp.]MDY5618744.1 bifunctional 2-keto-4-hydroxyglutarate aldolase/2-keto-3-deoxy-6-phosphogluconate aldolase [Lachnospiraceae bacte
MTKEQILSKIKENGLVAVVRAENAKEAKKITEACIAGGCASVEITFTVPGAHHIIEELAHDYRPEEILIGAGTVLDAQTARVAILSGAQYIVSSSFDKETAKLCNLYKIPYMPGCMTLKEISEALQYGVDIVKIFPGNVLKVDFVKAVKGPMPQVEMMPSGGVDVDNVQTWIKAGCVAVGAGGSLIAGAKTGDYQAITDLAKRFSENIKAARQN